MQYKIETLATFDREVKRLSKRYPSIVSDIKALKAEILANPLLDVSLGNNVRKIRMRITSKGRGKSGGARVITITVVTTVQETEIDLLYIYDKAERETISLAEIWDLLKDCGIL